MKDFLGSAFWDAYASAIIFNSSHRVCLSPYLIALWFFSISELKEVILANWLAAFPADFLLVSVACKENQALSACKLKNHQETSV